MTTIEEQEAAVAIAQFALVLYCSSVLRPWTVYTEAHSAFKQGHRGLNDFIPGSNQIGSNKINEDLSKHVTLFEIALL